MNQESEALRDAYTAARDVNVYQQAPSPAPKARRIWGSVPARNPGFTGREHLLGAVGDTLASGGLAVAQALHGTGGVGKTQLAIEYAHRHASDYDIVWWLNSENASLLGEQFAALAAELACASEGVPLAVLRRAVLMALHERGRWLLIFDNAEKPEDVAGWLPGGDGHVLITSRAPNWHDLAVPVEIDVFTRTESVETLRRRVPHLSEGDADQVAKAVGDLPLAVAQAAGYMALTDIPPDEYIRLLKVRPADVLDLGKPWSYPRSLAAATMLSLDQMRAEDPAAAGVATICAFLAPEPVPADWFPRAAAHLPEPLAGPANDVIAWRQVLVRLRGSGMLRVSNGTLLMHRLTQAIIREESTEEPITARGTAAMVLTVNHPGDPELPANWPAWARLFPHLVALDPPNSDDASLRSLGTDGIWYLLNRGDARAAAGMARDAYAQWRIDLGADHPDTLRSAHNLAVALWGLGELEAARDLNEDTLGRRRRVLGREHPYTLSSASNLADSLRYLGDFSAARGLHEDTLARRRRVLGEDHPSTLSSASNLAATLRGLGELEAARRLNKDVLARRRRVLGEDHPHTLISASNLAATLRDLGEPEAARDLDQDTLARQRRVLGEDHPDTLRSAASLAKDIEARAG